MPDSAFDIYQTQNGYVAVTSPVRRQILAALAARDHELGDLVELTGKAKPTLSSVHLKDLIEQGLVEGVAHADDSRRKSFRLIARRIGSSDLPVDSLRDAVKAYVEASPLAARFPLSVAFAALAAAPGDAPVRVLRAQARRLGQDTARLFSADDSRDLMLDLGRFLEQENLAKALRLDLELGSIEVAFLAGLPADAASDRLGLLLAGFIEGVGVGKGLFTSVRHEAAEKRRCVLHIG